MAVQTPASPPASVFFLSSHSETRRQAPVDPQQGSVSGPFSAPYTLLLRVSAGLLKNERRENCQGSSATEGFAYCCLLRRNYKM